MAWYIGIVLLCLGGVISSLNCYLWFIRYPMHRLRGGTRESYRWISGFPLVGSLFLWMAAVFLLHHRILMWTALAISLLDTGGIHWFAGVMLYWLARSPRGNRSHG